MKKLFFEISALLIVLITIIFGLEFCFKNYITPVDYRLKPLSHLEKEVEQLTIGASHTQALLNNPIKKGAFNIQCIIRRTRSLS